MSHQRTKITPASIRAIKGLEQVGYLPRCGIYFLCKKDQVVYIGRSINVAARVAAYSKKWYDRIYFLPLSRVCLKPLEQALINVLKPKYNNGRQRGRWKIHEPSENDRQLVAGLFTASTSHKQLLTALEVMHG